VGALHAVGVIMKGCGLIPKDADVNGVLRSVWQDWLDRRTSTPVSLGIVKPRNTCSAWGSTLTINSLFTLSSAKKSRKSPFFRKNMSLQPH
jgi:hypothetical protein